MSFSYTHQGNSVVVKISAARLDAALAPDFKQYATMIIEKGAEIIVLDLATVEFIDSSGLGAIVSVLKQLNGIGEVKLAGVNPAVKDLFQLTRMDRIFSSFDNIDDALAAV